MAQRRDGGADDEESGPRERPRAVNPRATAAHLARIERYRALVEERGWIFAPPTPPRPLTSLLEHLSNGQLERLAV